jgi:hypothetical protein
MHGNLDLIAYCGLYCGACSFKLAVDENDRAHVLSLPDRYEKAKQAELETCPGCRNEVVAANGDPCKTRACARARAFDHCGVCPDFPCDALSAFAGDGVPHHGQTLENLRRIRDVGTASWLSEQEAQWTCSCGAKRSWYVDRCPKCGARLPGHL